MLFFKHPTPFIQKPVAMQVAERKTAALPDHKVIVVERRARVTAFPEPENK